MIYLYSMCGGADFSGASVQEVESKLKKDKAKNLTGTAIHADLVKVQWIKDGVGNISVAAGIPGMRWWIEDWFVPDSASIPDSVFLEKAFGNQ